MLDVGVNRRTTSVPPPPRPAARSWASRWDRTKVPALRAALKGRLLSGLITNEATASALLV